MTLPWLSRTDRLLLSILLVGAVLVALLAWLVQAPERTGGVLREPSTFYNAPYGAKAAYEVLERLGFPVTRLRRPIVAETLEGIGTLVVLEPAPLRERVFAPPLPGYERYELRILADWIKEGHALIVAPGGGRRGSRLADWFALRSVEGEPGEKAEAQPQTTLAPGSGGASVGGLTQNGEDCLGLVSFRWPRRLEDGPKAQPFAQPRATPSGSESFQDVILPAQRANRSPEEPLARWADPPSNLFSVPQGVALGWENRRPFGASKERSEPLLSGVGTLVAAGDRRFRSKSPLRGPLADAQAHAFWTDAQGIVGLRATLGKGAVVALADSYPLSNLGIAEADNGLLLGNLAREMSARYPGQIAFDEYHLGFPQQDWSSLAMVKLLAAGPWRWAIGQALLACLLGLYAGAIRFGSPRDLARAPRRQHREFAEAAGRLLEQAGGGALAAEALYRHYRDRICRAAALDCKPHTPSAEETAHGVWGLHHGETAHGGCLPHYQRELRAKVAGRCGPEAADALEQAAAAADGPVGPQKLLAVFRKLHHLVETLEHGT